MEVLLVTPEGEGHVTGFFGFHRFPWPQDTLWHTASLPCGDWPSASAAALRLYRERHAVGR